MKRIEPTLKARDLDETIEFYRDLLGFGVDLLWPEQSPTFCLLVRDEVRLMFYIDDQPGEPQLSGQLRLDMDGVIPLYESIREHVKTDWGPEVYSYGRREVSIADCNGYSIILTETTSDTPTCNVD